MSQTRYTNDHEWVRLDGDATPAGGAGIPVTVGITDHAQKALGDLVFIELPEPGREIAAGEAVAVVESVKAASDVYAPLAGHVTEVNAAVVDDPSLVNREPTGDGWFFKMTLANAAAFNALLDEAAYTALVDAA